ncbi:hypothetical protein MC28_3767 [Bacillus thuringiensis MC28]|nr:hypothetical protein MC28_3767 [Bacillus thuringiensis MC28]PKR93806.1 Non-canonical purine NTP pyrophosphatase [Bacillus cereus Rock4-18]
MKYKNILFLYFNTAKSLLKNQNYTNKNPQQQTQRIHH